MILGGLLRLALVRTLRPLPLACLALVAAGSLAQSGLADTSLLALESSLRALAEHGARREALWTVLVALGIPWLVLQAAGLLPGWRRHEIDWLAPRAPAPLALVASSWLGLVLAALVLGAGAALAAELAAPRGGPSWRAGRAALAGAGDWVGHEPATRLALAPALGALPAGTRLELFFAFAGGGAQAEVVARVRAAGSDAPLAEVRRAIQARGSLELVLPECPAGAALELAVAAPGQRLFHEAEAARVWLPTPSERLASLTTLAQFLLDACACSALALGLGGWLGRATTLFALLALALVALFADADAGWLPLGNWSTTLEVLRAGRVPRWPEGAQCASVLAFVAGGLALGAASLRRWRRER